MTETPDVEPEIARIKSRISALIEEQLDRKGIYYLAQLGAQLGDDRVQLEKITRTKIGQFVRDNFDYEIGTTGQYNNVLFVKRPGSDAEATPSANVVRYSPRFWAAFAVPLRPDEERVIDLDSCEFGDRKSFDPSSGEIRPIAPEFIAPKGASGSAADTAARITKWLETEALDSERFIMRPRRSRSVDGNLLNHLLSALDRDQLRRVALPLDVIKALADRRF